MYTMPSHVFGGGPNTRYSPTEDSAIIKCALIGQQEWWVQAEGVFEPRRASSGLCSRFSKLRDYDLLPSHEAIRRIRLRIHRGLPPANAGKPLRQAEWAALERMVAHGLDEVAISMLLERVPSHIQRAIQKLKTRETTAPVPIEAPKNAVTNTVSDGSRVVTYTVRVDFDQETVEVTTAKFSPRLRRVGT